MGALFSRGGGVQGGVNFLGFMLCVQFVKTLCFLRKGGSNCKGMCVLDIVGPLWYELFNSIF